MKHPGRPLSVHSDHCLCGSGRLLRDCCLVVRCDTTPRGPPTGYAHPACFARGLDDCSRKISREHYISESVMRLFHVRSVTVEGLPWIPHGEQKEVSLASMTGNMLCTRHNEALSALDAKASAFFRFFTGEWSSDRVEVFLSRGYDLERWLLKMLCGLVMSGNATLHGRRLLTWTPPSEWLQILFGSSDVEAPAGLHSIVGRYQTTAGSLLVHPIFKSVTAHPIALVLAVEGIAFLFAMEALPPMRQPSKLGADTRYRPMALQVKWSGRIREAHFGWPDGRVVTLNKRP